MPMGEVNIQSRSMLYVTGTVSDSGDNELVAAPGSNIRIIVVAFVIQNESSTATTMILKEGSTARFRVLGQNQGDGLTFCFAPGREWKLAANTALNLNLDGANACGFSIAYYTE
jgi:hypothetical protein